PTGAIQHTREFEGAVQHFNNLTLRFVPDPLVPAVPYKPPKGSDAFPRRALGEITRALIAAWDAPPPPFPSKEQLEGDSGAAHGKPKQAGLDPTAMGRQLAAKAREAKVPASEAPPPAEAKAPPAETPPPAEAKAPAAEMPPPAEAKAPAAEAPPPAEVPAPGTDAEAPPPATPEPGDRGPLR